MTVAESTFAERLRQLREAAGVSQYRLAQLSGVKKQTISLLESGANQPSWTTVRKLAQALGLSVLDFDTGESVIPAPPADPAEDDLPPSPLPISKRK